MRDVGGGAFAGMTERRRTATFFLGLGRLFFSSWIVYPLIGFRSRLVIAFVRGGVVEVVKVWEVSSSVFVVCVERRMGRRAAIGEGGPQVAFGAALFALTLVVGGRQVPCSQS